MGRTASRCNPQQFCKWLKRKAKKQIEEEKEKIGEIYEGGVEPLRRDIESWRKELEAARDVGKAYSVVYYRERAGKGDLRAYYTSDVWLQSR